MLTITVLQYTPVHKKGTKLSAKEFRESYPTIINKDNSDSFLITWLVTHYSEWFLVSEEFTDQNPEENTPLACILDELYYIKDFSGMYTAWTSPSARASGAKPVLHCTIAEVREKIKRKAYNQYVLYCTENVNKKL